jgi:hypothetical protein
LGLATSSLAAARPAPASRKAANPANLRPTTEHIKLPVGSAGIAPLVGERAWALSNCKNTHDPITGIPFASADPTTLQDLIRLHNRTCVVSGPLNDKVAAEHKADFPLLSDPTKDTAKAYGVLNEQRGFANRWTFYIGKDGRIQAIDKEVGTRLATSAEDMAAKMRV